MLKYLNALACFLAAGLSSLLWYVPGKMPPTAAMLGIAGLTFVFMVWSKLLIVRVRERRELERRR